MITIVPTDHKYFAWWRFQELIQLSHDFEELFNCTLQFKLWYDESEDYHRLDFSYNGHRIEVRLYKVLGVKIDGIDDWRVFGIRYSWNFARAVRDRVNEFSARTTEKLHGTVESQSSLPA